MPAAAVVVIGPCGSGKTTTAQALAAALARPFVDADSLHPPENRAKMARGEPLSDADRAPWLAAVAERCAGQDGGRVVLACSALRRVYRDRLRAGLPGCVFVLLDVPGKVLAERLRARQGHFAGLGLLESQLRTLERPDPAESDVVVVPVGAECGPEEVLRLVRRCVA